MRKTVAINVRGVPRKLKVALIRDSRETETSIRSLAARVLGAYFGIPILDGWRKSHGSPNPDGDQLHIVLPMRLANELYWHSREQGLTQSSAVVGILSDYYGVRYQPRLRGGKKMAA